MLQPWNFKSNCIAAKIKNVNIIVLTCFFLCKTSSSIDLILSEKVGTIDKNASPEQWENLYQKQAENRIFSVEAQKSDFFSEFIGKPFPVASFVAHAK